MAGEHERSVDVSAAALLGLIGRELVARGAGEREVVATLSLVELDSWWEQFGEPAVAELGRRTAEAASVPF